MNRRTVPLGYPGPLRDPELATPISTAMNVPIPRTRQITSSASACGLRRKKLAISCTGTSNEAYLPCCHVPHGSEGYAVMSARGPL